MTETPNAYKLFSLDGPLFIDSPPPIQVAINFPNSCLPSREYYINYYIKNNSAKMFVSR